MKTLWIVAFMPFFGGGGGNCRPPGLGCQTPCLTDIIFVMRLSPVIISHTRKWRGKAERWSLTAPWGDSDGFPVHGHPRARHGPLDRILHARPRDARGVAAEHPRDGRKDRGPEEPAREPAARAELVPTEGNAQAIPPRGRARPPRVPRAGRR